MSPIQVLDQTLIDQIAAGEVIVRPASVVKELVENSLDAAAERVTVEVEKDCRSIKVADDGVGIPPEQIQLAILRHATSKIASLDDLARIRTRGFRGEALASIVAVSRFEILSRPPQAVAGTRLRAEGGAIVECKGAGCAPGTSISILDLFYNTPARLKFMKSPAAEWSQIQAILTRQALAAPNAGFAVFYAGRKAWEAPPGQTLRGRIEQLLGARTADEMIEVAQESDGVAYRGFVGRPQCDRADRRQQFFFVNGRPIVSARLAPVLLDAYKGLIMSRRYPVAVLGIEIDPEEVDVNVHPTKEEVRFRNENKIAGLLHRAVVAALRAERHIPSFSSAGQPTGAVPSVSPTAQDPTLPLMFGREKIKSDSSWPPEEGAARGPARPSPAPPLAPAETRPAAEARVGDESAREGSRAPNAFAPAEFAPLAASSEPIALPPGVRPAVIGQFGDAYILAELGGNLLLIDQHAAHERILYEKLKDSLQRPAIQTLMIPLHFAVSPADAPVLERLLPHLAGLGIEVEPFGGLDYIVNAVPSDLDSRDIAAVIQDLIDAYHGRGVEDDAAEAIRDKALTRMACRAAAKAGQRLAPAEVERLIADLAATRLSFACPHGRPTMILLTKDQLDRQFRRR